MNAGGLAHPASDSWAAAIHTSPSDFEPLGAGVVIDDRRVLTCAHVGTSREELWIAFPKAGDAGIRRRVDRVIMPDGPSPVNDLGILVLKDPVPPSVTPALLRDPHPVDLVGRRWWAYEYPSGDPIGNSAGGTVGEALDYGWILLYKDSRYDVEHGFSGAGLWSPDYDAVVAVIGHVNDQGDARAITLNTAVRCFQDQDLNGLTERHSVTLAGEQALAEWGWSLPGDAEGARHWRPRARGVGIDSERGWRFCGRATALTEIKKWLDRDVPDRRVLVVTGRPGSGKSAVLGRIVTTADRTVAAELPAEDTAVRASPDSVACAVHAKGKTALEIATEIARAASAALPEIVEDFAPALRRALSQRALPETGSRRFNVIIDALDESLEPSMAVAKVILALAETCADVGAQAVVGSRRHIGHVDLTAAFGPTAHVIDLDDPRFFAPADITAYARATLQLAGDERSANPYADDDAADRVAARIAELSDGNFLIACLTARTRGMYDEHAADSATLSFTATVDAAIREYLQRIRPVAGVSAEALLTALAFAESPGFDIGLWRATLSALGCGDVPTAQLTRFARSSAASFLVETSAQDGHDLTFRLFHQALNDALLRDREKFVSPLDDEQALSIAFLAIGRNTGWEHAPPYLLRSLPVHAARAGLTDALLTDDAYLVHADLHRLLPFVDLATSAAGRRRARLLHLTPEAVAADPAYRTGLFSVSETAENLGDSYTRGGGPAPYRAAWAAVSPRAEHSVLRGDHKGLVAALCSFTLDGRVQLASGGGAFSDRNVRIWDAATGTLQSTMAGHDDDITGMCAFKLSGEVVLIATSSRDGTIRIWNPATATCEKVLRGHAGKVKQVCSFTQDDRYLIATCGEDETVRVWDPASGTEKMTLTGHAGGVESVCAFAVDGRVMLVSGGLDGTVRIWDAATGTQQAVLTGGASIYLVHAFAGDDGGILLAASDSNRTVRIWAVATLAEHAVLRGYSHPVWAIQAFNLHDRTLLAIGEGDGVFQIWDPDAGILLSTLPREVYELCDICAFDLGGGTLLATADGDGRIRIWDPAVAYTEDSALRVDDGCIWSVCAVARGEKTMLATGSEDGEVRIWDPITGAPHWLEDSGFESVNAMCVFSLGDRTLLAAAGGPGGIRTWDAVTGEFAVSPRRRPSLALDNVRTHPG